MACGRMRSRLPHARLLQHAEEQDGVVRQVLPDAGHVGTHLDAVLAQMRGRADAHLHQEVRRVDAAERADHLAAVKVFSSPLMRTFTPVARRPSKVKAVTWRR